VHPDHLLAGGQARGDGVAPGQADGDRINHQPADGRFRGRITEQVGDDLVRDPHSAGEQKTRPLDGEQAASSQRGRRAEVAEGGRIVDVEPD
jgi:hypothetical protein